MDRHADDHRREQPSHTAQIGNCDVCGSHHERGKYDLAGNLE
jgi:hypothetical protein